MNDTLGMTLSKKAIKCAGLVITVGTIAYGATQAIASRKHVKTRTDHLVSLAGTKGLSKKHVNSAGKETFVTIAQLATIATAAIELANHIAQVAAKDVTVKAAEVKKAAPKHSAEAKTLIDAKEKFIVANAIKTERLAKQAVKASKYGSKNAKKKVATFKKDAVKTTKAVIKRVNKNL